MYLPPKWVFMCSFIWITALPHTLHIVLIIGLGLRAQEHLHLFWLVGSDIPHLSHSLFGCWTACILKPSFVNLKIIIYLTGASKSEDRLISTILTLNYISCTSSTCTRAILQFCQYVVYNRFLYGILYCIFDTEWNNSFLYVGEDASVDLKQQVIKTYTECM